MDHNSTSNMCLFLTGQKSDMRIKNHLKLKKPTGRIKYDTTLPEKSFSCPNARQILIM